MTGVQTCALPISLGTWGRVFIFAQQADGKNEVFTARSGRIDSSGDQSELVLTDVLATKFPDGNETDKQYVVERSEQLRISSNTGRSDIVQRLNERDTNADAMDWEDLRERASSGTEAQQREAARILNRRAALASAPFVFSLMAVALGMRVRRGGRSVGVLLTLLVVIVYYLISLLGESLARVGTVSPYVGPWLATVFIVGVSFLLLLFNRAQLSFSTAWFKRRGETDDKSAPSTRRRSAVGAVTMLRFPNLMDATLFRSLGLSFLVCFVALAAIFNIFTLFELWRFIAVTNASMALVARYLFFLLPLIAVELFPATMLISVLVTYALLAKRHEAIAWWASGQSVYRLMLPGIFFALAMAFGSWLVQEHVMPTSNLKQDALRARIPL